MRRSAQGILSLYIHTADSRSEDADLGALVGGFDYAGFFFDAYNSSDNAANGGYFITNRQGVTHFVYSLFLLFLHLAADNI